MQHYTQAPETVNCRTETERRRAASRKTFHANLKEWNNRWSANTIKVEKWLLDLRVSDGAKATFMLLAGFRDGQCYPSEPYLAERLGVCDRHVRRWLKQLEGAKLPVRDRSGQVRLRSVLSVRRARRQNNRYMLLRVGGPQPFALVPREIVEHPDLSPKAKVLAAVIAYRQADTRFIWRSAASLARDAHLSHTSALRAFHKLMRLGGLNVENGAPSETGDLEAWDMDGDLELNLIRARFGKQTMRLHRPRPRAEHASGGDTAPREPANAPPVSDQDAPPDTPFFKMSYQERPNGPPLSDQELHHGPPLSDQEPKTGPPVSSQQEPIQSQQEPIRSSEIRTDQNNNNRPSDDGRAHDQSPTHSKKEAGEERNCDAKALELRRQALIEQCRRLEAEQYGGPLELEDGGPFDCDLAPITQLEDSAGFIAIARNAEDTEASAAGATLAGRDDRRAT